MRYIKTTDISVGDRFAKTIFNKDGVLLYNSGVKVDASMIARLKDLNLYGTYILDNAEPAPPITDEELEFERFQWSQTYVVEDIFKEVLKQQRPAKMDTLIDLIYSRFTKLTDKMIFNQCLRGENDFLSKHSLNVAVLTALLARKTNCDIKETRYLIEAALLHDIGRALAPKEILNKEGGLTHEEMHIVHQSLLQGFNLISANYAYAAGVRRYIIQLSRELANRLPNLPRNDQNLLPGTKIIQVADIYDTLTAIRAYKSPISAFSAVKIMKQETDKYDSAMIENLEQCIRILPAGSYVELSTGEQGIVVSENDKAIDRPVVLGMVSNKLFDLSMKATYNEVQIVDTVFTPDNRQRIEVNVERFMKK